MSFRVLFSAMGLVAAASGALAADLPSGAPPPSFPPPIFSWTGFYVGVNGGYHWGGRATQFTGTDTNLLLGGGLGAALLAGEIPRTGAHGASGFIGGVGVGYNYQVNNIVFGVEADLDGATGRQNSRALLSIVIPPAFIVPPTLTRSSQKLDWLGTVRARLGWTPVERLLIYATGGLAYGQSSASFSVVNAAAGPPLSVAASSSARVGWTLGGGVEYALSGNWSNWSVKGEYLYYNLGRKTATVSYVNADPVTLAPELSTLTGHTRHTGNIVRAGLNYRF